MTFTSNIPQSGESLGSTRARINTNFQEVYNVQNVNHVNFNDIGEGKHKFLQMPEQSPDGPATLVNEGALYTKNDSTRTTLYWRQENTAANGAEIKMTGPNPVNAATGFTFLPGGFKLLWGNTAGSQAGTIVFDLAAELTSIYSVQLTAQKSSSSPVVTGLRLINAPTNISFTYSTTNAIDNIFWMAIGI